MHQGKRVELTSKDLAKAVEDKRKAWKKANPDAKPGTGPFPYRTSVLVRRAGADVPQTVRVTFADGSTATARFSGKRPWQRFEWTRHAKAVSVQLDPEGRHYLDATRIDNSRTLEADSPAPRRLATQFGAALQAFFSLLVSL